MRKFAGMIHISLFSGIGGFELAAEWAGWKNYASCEINPFGQQVLKYYWPDAYHHSDVKTLTYELLNTQLIQRFGTGWRNDDIIVTGGFPCQPYSQAGKRLGKADERHLWPEMLRIIREIKPTWVVGENVRGIINWSGGMVFDEVQSDLEALSYEVQPFLLPAAGVNAPHERYRTWFVAYSNNTRTDNRMRNFSNGQEIDEGWEQQSQHKLRSVDVIKNPMQCGCLQRESKQEGTEIREQRDTCAGDSVGIRISERNVAYTENIRQKTSWTTLYGRSGFENGNTRVTTNPMRNRQPGKEHGQTEPGQFTKAFIPNDWDNFPTQSPICSGNDGISNRLDGITFPKWRNESIKAYGNSVVPQLVFQIFKAINEFK